MPYAREQQRRYQKNWLKRRREAWLHKNGPCVECGSWEGLQVDHRDPAQKVTHRVWSWSAARRDVELAKCQPLCEKCHLLKTRRFFAARAGEMVHGRGYHRGCRCRLCRGWNAIRKRLDRWRQGVHQSDLPENASASSPH